PLLWAPASSSPSSRRPRRSSARRRIRPPPTQRPPEGNPADPVSWPLDYLRGRAELESRHRFHPGALGRHRDSPRVRLDARLESVGFLGRPDACAPRDGGAEAAIDLRRELRRRARPGDPRFLLAAGDRDAGGPLARFRRALLRVLELPPHVLALVVSGA